MGGKYYAPLAYVEKYYREDAEDDVRFPKEAKFWRSFLKQVQGKSVLSVGCGPQFYDDCQFFKSVPKEYVGMDVNRAVFDFLRSSTHTRLINGKKYAARHGIRTKLICGDITRYCMRFMERFDTILAVGVLGNFGEEKLGQLVEYLHEYLKKGGLLINVEWTDCHLPTREFHKKLQYRFYADRVPSMETIAKILKEKGFSIERQAVFDVENPKAYGWGKIYGYVARKR